MSASLIRGVRRAVLALDRRKRSAASGPDAAHTILTVTDNGDGFARFTTAAVHGLAGGENVSIAGNAYATPTCLVTGVGGATFVTDLGYDADDTGGTWSLI